MTTTTTPTDVTPRDTLHALVAQTIERDLRQQQLMRELVDPARQADRLAESVVALFARVYQGAAHNRPVLAAYTSPRPASPTP